MTRILIIIVIAASAYLMLTSSGQASTGNSQPAISAQDCYNHANGIVSPAWSGMNRIQRSVLAMQIINQCEGNR